MLERPVLLFSILVSLLGCEAQTTVQTRFVLPSSMMASPTTLSQLHVSVLSSGSFTQKLSLLDGKCPAYTSSTSSDKPKVSIVDEKFTMEQSRIPSVPEFCAAAWFDANSNSDIDTGDAMGQLAVPYPVQPSTFFGSNRYNSPNVVLEVIK